MARSVPFVETASGLFLPQPGMTLIKKITLNTDTANGGAQGIALSFDAIPQEFTILKLYSAIHVSNPSARGNVRMQFNGDNVANYDAMISEMFDGGTPTNSMFGNAGPPNNIRIANAPHDTSAAGANAFTLAETTIPFYSSNNIYKGAFSQAMVTSDGQYAGAPAAGKGPTINQHFGRWFNTAPITSIQLNHSSGEGTIAIKANSVFVLYAF